MQPDALWQRMYAGSKMTGRRGPLICAMGAIDMALWDIKGKALSVPVWELLGANRKKRSRRMPRSSQPDRRSTTTEIL